jgi:hypothetical protein
MPMTTCPDCLGATTVERHVFGLGIIETRCPNDWCDDGQVTR